MLQIFYNLLNLMHSHFHNIVTHTRGQSWYNVIIK